MIAAHWMIHCDFCHGAIDDGTVGTRTRAEAIAEAKRFGYRRVKAVDGKRYDICGNCDRDRCGSSSPPSVTR